MTTQLHLSSLAVEGFRGISALRLPELGRVTLLTGRNSIGKTTVLDAVRLYASGGDARVLVDLIDGREEFVLGTDEGGDTVLFPDFASLFHDYDAQRDEAPSPIRIRSGTASRNLSLKLVQAKGGADDDERFLEDAPRDLQITVGRRNASFGARPMSYYDQMRRRFLIPRTRPRSLHRPIPMQSLGPGLLDNVAAANLWDTVALTTAEDLALDALRLVAGSELERLTVVGDPAFRQGRAARRVVAKLAGVSEPIPLKRLGDGANRLLTMALALANARDGLLLLDEVENGIHYSIQSDLWRMIFAAAEAGNTQVIAATHSYDCVAGFAVAALETPSTGVLFRLERPGTDHAPVLYSEEDLEVAARHGTEVR